MCIYVCIHTYIYMYSKMIDLLNLQSVSFKEFRLFPIITFVYRPGLIKQHNMCLRERSENMRGTTTLCFLSFTEVPPYR